ncbi:DMSO reductase anchor subunit [Asanoa hainanensis]|uniref:DMSO reductase anchor subunit n=1 Tax=Asanoa hainanensis TaxID=560556 RepID=A0A239HYZ3_9ACTN|nr:hypothetical protein [Asanoa hainanensis]SNS86597.1 DMSO reductase anchor subunit [Asanoa hainanensis]
MAYRTWGRVLLAALGVGLLAGAGQLGFAYGLGVVRFARDFEQSPGQWTAHLAWVAWFAMLAAVAGALAGAWLAARDDLRPTLGSRVAVAVAGGVGAMAVAPLAMLPSRVATIPSGNAVTIAGLSAVLGALVGVFAAVAVLSQRVVGLNLGAVTVVVWLVALLSVAPSLGPDDPLPAVRLGVLDASWLGGSLAQRLAVIVMPAIALAAGAGIGLLARWRGLPVIPVAVSGVVGPALLALAYLIAGPGDDPDRYQAAPYWGALIAVAAGGLGSVLAAVARQLTGARPATDPPGRHGDHTAEVFPGSPEVTADRDEETRTFDAWGTGKSDGRFGDDKPTSSFDRDDLDPPGATSGGGFGRDPLGGPGNRRDILDDGHSGSFGSGRDDSLGGFGSGPSAGRDDSLGGFGSGPSAARDDPLGSFGSSRSASRDDSPGGFGSGPSSGRGDSLGSFGSSASGGRDDSLGSFGSGPSADRDDSLGSFGSSASASRDDSLGSFGSGASAGRDDSLGGSGRGRARDLGDVERSTPPQAGEGSTGGSLFNPPKPVAPPRQPEVVSPPPGPEPTPIRPFDRQPASGPGDWRTDKTSSFTPASVPVVPANGPQRRDDGEVTQRPSAIRPQPATPNRVPRQPGVGDGGGLAPVDLPDQSPRSSGSGRRGGPVRLDDPTREAGAGRHGQPDQLSDPTGGSAGPDSSDWGGRSDWSGGSTRPAATAGSAETSGEMPDWRLAPPAWTPPPPITPGSGSEATADARTEPPTTEAAPAKPAPEQKRRGLFRRKNKSEPAPTETDWVEVPAAADPAPAAADSVPTTAGQTPTGPRGFGFGGLVSGRFGGGDQDAETTGGWADRDQGTADSRGSFDAGSANPRPGAFDRDGGTPGSRPGGSDRDGGTPGPRPGSLDRDGGAYDRDSGSGQPRFGGGPTEARPHLGSVPDGTDDGGRRSWADRARGAEDQPPAESPADGGTPAKDRGGRKSGRSDRHLRSVDLGSGQKRADDGDTGSWDIDDPAPTRTDAAKPDDAKPDAAEPAPSRGLFRRKKNDSAESAEAPAEPAGDPTPEPARGRRGKGDKGSDKPIGQRDEEYVDWVTALGAPEPLNERRRDDTPRRSLRSTTQRKDD